MGAAPADERKLIARLRRRDERAFRQLVEQYQGQVFNVVFRILGDAAEAEDVTQEVFVAVFRAIARFRGDARLSTWIFRIAVNHCRNRLKYLGRRHHNRTSSLDDVHEAADMRVLGERPAQPDGLVRGHRLQQALRAAMASLDVEQRELVVLRDMSGLSYQEIQRVTGLPSGTVKSRLHRARVALQEALEPYLS